MFTKKIANILYLLNKRLKVKVHKMLGRQTNIYIPTYFYADSTNSGILQA